MSNTIKLKVMLHDKTKRRNCLDQPTGAMVKSQSNTTDNPFYAFCISKRAWKYIYKNEVNASLWKETEKLYEALEAGDQIEAYVEVNDNELYDHVLKLEIASDNIPIVKIDAKAYLGIDHYGIF